MFTGIITAIGEIGDAKNLGAGSDYGQRLLIVVRNSPDYLADVALGDSIALNGACMTVVSISEDLQSFFIDISAHSLSKTAGLSLGNVVNLEKALRASDRLGGHVVSGHVDGVGQVRVFEQVGESWLLRIWLDAALAPFMAKKGSVAINGVSLTVNDVVDFKDENSQNLKKGCFIDINLIPHTLENTALNLLKKDALVNVEIDVMARYAQRILAWENF